MRLRCGFKNYKSHVSFSVFITCTYNAFYSFSSLLDKPLTVNDRKSEILKICKTGECYSKLPRGFM